jgi:predicted ArsR family transcriptional regulator
VQEIAQVLLEGCENSEIARQLEITTRTVKGHLSRLKPLEGLNTMSPEKAPTRKEPTFHISVILIASSPKRRFRL